jgi:hypothetical protein
MYELFTVMRCVVEAVDVVVCKGQIIGQKQKSSLGQARLPNSLLHALPCDRVHYNMADSNPNPTTALLHSSTLISQGAEAASLVDSTYGRQLLIYVRRKFIARAYIQGMRQCY